MRKRLDNETKAKFAELTEEDVQSLLFDGKWRPALKSAVMSIFETSLRRFSTSLASLAGRYARTLGELEAEVANSQAEVHTVLRKMGFNW